MNQLSSELSRTKFCQEQIQLCVTYLANQPGWPERTTGGRQHADAMRMVQCILRTPITSENESGYDDRTIPVGVR
eukprot:scaffold11860_cov95-Skeletonema_dohrnii-CCMP3373.AAC.1